MPESRKGAVGLTAAAAAVALAAPLLIPVSAHAVSGTAETDNARGFTVRLDIGNGQRGCSGVLVDATWLLSAASCFVDDPSQGLDVPAGKPALHTTATVGRTDLTTTAGHVRDVVELVPRGDRDVVLARLSAPVPNVPPIALASSAPAAGENVTAAGYGRTKEEWAPLKLHTGSFTTGAPAGNELPVTGQDGVALCAGDTGGPLLRGTGAGAELVGVNSRSSQGGCFGIDATQTGTDGFAARVDDLTSWVRSKIGQTPVTDFNCDAVEDVAAGDPRATVGGDAAAGLVRVVYGGGKGTEQIDQDASFVPGGAEPGDRFGEALATADHNQDGCTDLIVGVPYENVQGQTDAGMVSVIHGSRDGLGKGPASTNYEQGVGSGSFAASASEAGDRMGFSVAAGQTAQGAPYLLIGTPGEDLGDLADAGNSFYVQSGRSAAVHQDKPGVAGVAEAGDRFGHSVAGDANHIAIGAPGEAVGTETDSGMIQVLGHTWNADGLPTPVKGLDQDSEGVSGGAEADDEFGADVALTEYRPAGAATANHSLLAVGSPGEALTANGTSRADAGRVVTFHITASGGWSQQSDIHQNWDDISGTPEKGDRFGEQVAVTNTAPRATGTAATMLIAVGAPGEAVGSVAGAGAVQQFSLLGNPGDADHWIQAGNGYGLPGTPGAGERLGGVLTATGTQLYFGMPNGPSAYGAVHTMPWSNLTGGTAGPVTTYAPGQNGLPAAGQAFGTTVQ